MKKRYLAFDLGASSGRAIIGELENGKLSLEEIHRFKNGAIEKDGSLFWDFDALWNEIKTGVKKAAALGGDISSIAVDTWGVDYLLLKSDGEFARLPYMYRDSRTNGVIEKVFDIVPEEEVYSSAGIQKMPFNTLFQLFAHKDQHPEDLEGTKIMLIPDALTYMLCGKVACEYTDASTSQLLDANKREWNFDLIEKLGIPKSIFPEIVEPGTVAATLREELQEELGCGPVKVCHIGSHDTASAVASVPAPEKGEWAYTSCGTWVLLGAELDSPLLSKEAMNGNFTNEGGLNGKIRFLSNIMGMWLIQETKRVWEEDGKELSFAQIEDMAKAAPALKCLVNPNDASFMAPKRMPDAVREFCAKAGCSGEMDDSTVIRCIYDSLALCFKEKLEELQKILGVKYECLNMVGGGTKDAFLMQLTANSTGIPVVAGPVEATAIGNLLGQAIADGDIAGLKEARQIVKDSFELIEYKPDASARADWDKAFERYMKLV